MKDREQTKLNLEKDTKKKEARKKDKQLLPNTFIVYESNKEMKGGEA